MLPWQLRGKGTPHTESSESAEFARAFPPKPMIPPLIMGDDERPGRQSGHRARNNPQRCGMVLQCFRSTQYEHPLSAVDAGDYEHSCTRP
jgi:hypothetical protein